MLANSYLILAPAEATDIASAAMTQRQTIPFVWAIAVSSPSTTFVETNQHYYFSTTVGEALAMLDRGMAAWNYNSYFRDTLAPVGVFRSWLANYPSETGLYLNGTELIAGSPSQEKDIAELRRLGEKVRGALEEIEEKHFTIFLQELRKLSYPFVTVPITGDRDLDAEILTFEIRDTSSVEAEMALQMVGVDRDKSILRNATRSIQLRKEPSPPATSGEATTNDSAEKVLTLFTSDIEEARNLFTDTLGCSLIRDSQGRLLLSANNTDFLVVKINDRTNSR